VGVAPPRPAAYDADAAELRVLGCLIEKQRTTPDAYPLSLNALRLACNQSTNRDPIVDYDESAIRDALERLSRRRWVRLASGAGSRAVKYRHLFDEALHLDGGEIALLCVLMLRGPQTVNELRTRTDQREDRWAHLLGGADAVAARATDDAPRDRTSAAMPVQHDANLEARVEHLEAALDALDERLARLENER
jgi:uncharacterized protein YceH (UPF0502 family)